MTRIPARTRLRRHVLALACAAGLTPVPAHAPGPCWATSTRASTKTGSRRRPAAGLRSVVLQPDSAVVAGGSAGQLIGYLPTEFVSELEVRGREHGIRVWALRAESEHAPSAELPA